MICILDLIKIAGVDLGHFKIHCATGKTNPIPLESYYAGHFKEWQEYQNGLNFNCARILSLIQYGKGKWLFAGVFDVNGVQKKAKENKVWYEYSTTEVAHLEHLTGKAIVTFDKTFRASYLKGTRFGSFLMVSELRPEKVSVRDFPGFNQVRISLHLLRIIIHQDLIGWKTALSNVAGVYLIADVATGKQYVGSAYGDQGLWQRWCEYGDTGHGSNKGLKQLLELKGGEYSKNFQFTILEVIDRNASPDYVIERENHWKDALLTRQFGYNIN